MIYVQYTIYNIRISIGKPQIYNRQNKQNQQNGQNKSSPHQKRDEQWFLSFVQIDEALQLSIKMQFIFISGINPVIKFFVIVNLCKL